MSPTSGHDAFLLPGSPLKLPLLLELGFCKTIPPSHVAWQASKGYRIYFLVGGASTWELSRYESTTISGGEVLLIPRGMKHRIQGEPGTPCPMYWVDFNPAVRRASTNTPFTEEELSALAHKLLSAGVHTGTASELLRNVLEQVIALQPALAPGAVEPPPLPWLRALVCQAIIEATRCLFDTHSESKNSEYITAAHKFMEERLSEHISINEVAAHLGYSPSRTYELFKACTGLTPNDYLIRLRVKAATDLLDNSSLTVTEIAFEVGFSSSQYFARVFRKYKGFAPSEYRRREN
jgi:AraC-like DNA-binding protein